MAFGRILFATDFSESSERAFDVALDMTLRSGAKLTILHVCEMPVFSYTNGMTYVATPDVMADIDRVADQRLRQLEMRAAERGVVAEAVHVDGLPRDAIAAYADAHGHDLIIVGSHGRRGFRRFALGSVAEHVVRVANVPVLTVHSQPAAVAAAHT